MLYNLSHTKSDIGGLGLEGPKGTWTTETDSFVLGPNMT